MDERKAELKQLQEQLTAAHKAVKEAEAGEGGCSCCQTLTGLAWHASSCLGSRDTGQQ